MIFKNFGQNLRAPDGRLGVSGADDVVNGADTGIRPDRDRLSKRNDSEPTSNSPSLFAQ